MCKKPYEMSSVEWHRAYAAAASGGVQERVTRSSASQMISEFRSRDALRFGARKSVSDRLAAATRGDVTMTNHRANRLLSILECPIHHRDVVVTALKQGLAVPSEVLAQYPGLVLRTYRAARSSGA